MKKEKLIKAWVVTDWDGRIKHPSVSIFDTKKEAKKELDQLNKLPDPVTKGEGNKIVKVYIAY